MVDYISTQQRLSFLMNFRMMLMLVTIYIVCVTVVRKFDQELSAFKDENEKLAKDKGQLMIKNAQLLG